MHIKEVPLKKAAPAALLLPCLLPFIYLESLKLQCKKVGSEKSKKWWLCSSSNFMKNFGWKIDGRKGFLIEKVFYTWLPVGANVHRWFWLEYRWFWNHWEASARVPDGLQFSVPKKCTLVGNYEHWDWTKSPEKQRVITDGLGLLFSGPGPPQNGLIAGDTLDTEIINEVYQTPSKPPLEGTLYLFLWLSNIRRPSNI